MSTELNDPRSILQVIGCMLLNPDLIDEHPLERSDFEVEEFHEIIFASIYNLWQSGVRKIDDFAIDQFLASYPKQYKIFTNNKGLEWVNDAIQFCEPENFLYYYQKLKKLSYLRYLENQGVDTSSIYNPSITDPSKLEAENYKFDKMTVNDLFDIVENRFITEAKIRYGIQNCHSGQLAGEGMMALKESYKTAPEFGLNFFDPVTTTIARGARLSKFYLYSSNTGGGKSRMALASLCMLAIPWIWDIEAEQWVYTGVSEPSLFISTELEKDELQTIIQAYVSGVPEDHILNGEYLPGEEERVDQAIRYIESSPLYLEELFDFGIQDVENLIKKYKRTFGVGYFCFDYIHTSAKLIGEIASLSKGMRLREDQCLFLLSDKIKSLCDKLKVFVLSGTQLNGEWKSATEKDSTILRGAKNLADRVDLGVIFLEPSKAELEAIKPILTKHVGIPIPNRISHVYKCRRGKYTKVRLWHYVDLSTCRIKTLFVTTNDYKIIPIQATNVKPEDVDKMIEEHSVSAGEIECTQEEQAEAGKMFFNF